jgi:hypothetical protein
MSPDNALLGAGLYMLGLWLGFLGIVMLVVK